jgi:hypothetical protein
LYSGQGYAEAGPLFVVYVMMTLLIRIAPPASAPRRSGRRLGASVLTARASTIFGTDPPQCRSAPEQTSPWSLTCLGPLDGGHARHPHPSERRGSGGRDGRCRAPHRGAVRHRGESGGESFPHVRGFVVKWSGRNRRSRHVVGQGKARPRTHDASVAGPSPARPPNGRTYPGPDA